MKYVCGCDVGPSLQGLKADPEWARNWYDNDAKKDEEGFIICPEHSHRRSGWRSLPIIDSVKGRRFDFSLANLSPLNIEMYLITGQRPVTKKIILVGAEQDLRDNRDPEDAWATAKKLREQAAPQVAEMVATRPKRKRK